MSQSNYIESGIYEAYITLARQCKREEFGAHNKNMELLMDIEQGVTYSFFTRSKSSKLLPAAKKYIISATRFAIKRPDITKTDKASLRNFINRISEASSSQELLAICREGVEVLVKYKPS